MVLPIYISALLIIPPTDSVGFEHLASIEVEADYVTSDNVGNVLVVTDEAIASYNSTGEKQRNYSNKVLGAISTVDAQWALKPVVFYQDPGFVVFLDNTLSEQGEPINLAEHELQNAALMCTSYNNGMWFYDPLDYRLTKTSLQMEILLTTEYMNQLVGNDLDPFLMLEKDNLLYLADSSKGVIIFDQFGSYYNTIPIEGLTSMWVQGKLIYYLANGKLSSYNQLTFQHQSISLPEVASEIIRVRTEGNLLVVQTVDSVELYQIK